MSVKEKEELFPYQKNKNECSCCGWQTHHLMLIHGKDFPGTWVFQNNLQENIYICEVCYHLGLDEFYIYEHEGEKLAKVLGRTAHLLLENKPTAATAKDIDRLQSRIDLLEKTLDSILAWVEKKNPKGPKYGREDYVSITPSLEFKEIESLIRRVLT